MKIRNATEESLTCFKTRPVFLFPLSVYHHRPSVQSPLFFQPAVTRFGSTSFFSSVLFFFVCFFTGNCKNPSVVPAFETKLHRLSARHYLHFLTSTSWVIRAILLPLLDRNTFLAFPRLQIQNSATMLGHRSSILSTCFATTTTIFATHHF